MADPVYLTRAEIGYAEGPNSAVSQPYNELIVHTIVSGDYEPEPGFQEVPFDADLDWVRQACRNVSSYHRRERRWPGGIGYNHVTFPAVIGAPGGVVCEGQGFGRRGTHTEGRNSQWGMAFWGHGDLENADPTAWSAAEWLVRKALAERRLTSSYRVSGHRNYSTKGKTCPGNLIYPHLGRLRSLTITQPTPEPEDEMTPAQEKKLDDVAKAVAALTDRLDTLATGGHYAGHQTPGLLALITEVTKERSLRKLAEMNWNVFYGSDGKLRPVIAQALRID